MLDRGVDAASVPQRPTFQMGLKWSSFGSTTLESALGLERMRALTIPSSCWMKSTSVLIRSAFFCPGTPVFGGSVMRQG